MENLLLEVKTLRRASTEPPWSLRCGFVKPPPNPPAKPPSSLHRGFVELPLCLRRASDDDDGDDDDDDNDDDDDVVL